MTNSSKGKFLPKHRATVYSTGVASFDNLTGGGLVAGRIALFEEDFNNVHCSILSKHFISCSLSSQHHIAVILERDVDSFVKKLPKVIMQNKALLSSAQPSNMSIAWRYNAMKPIMNDEFALNINDNENDSTSDSSCFMHKFRFKSDSLSQNLSDTIEFIRNFIKENAASPKTPLRILIGSFGSAMWGDCADRSIYRQLITRFLRAIRPLIAATQVVMMMTVKAAVDKESELDTRIMESLSDYVFEFTAFEDTALVKEQLFNDLSGKVKVVKVPCVNSISRLFEPNTDIWSYTVRRTRMVFKEFSLPPCLSETTSRSNQTVPQSSGDAMSTVPDF